MSPKRPWGLATAGQLHHKELQMAEMIPDRLPSGASAGERKVFALLQQLPDDVVVYYEPVVANRYPDFIVIIPNVGLLIVEVKSWYPNTIVQANNLDVTLQVRGQSEKTKHPIRQARDYQFALMDVARRRPETAALLKTQGPYAGKFIFPFCHLVIMNNCTREQLNERGLSELFPAGRTWTRDEFEAFEPASLVERLKSCFDPWWPFDRLSDRQIAILRSIIHPEIAVSHQAQFDLGEQTSLAVLDFRQERNALSVGDGHRIVYGVAGSGKTIILVARARLIARDPKKFILILCYNVALSEHFQSLFSNVSNVICMNFHRWAVLRNGIRIQDREEDEALGERLLQRLQTGEGESHKYDAVFIDEAQDFSMSWFQCAKLALKEIDDGDFLIVGDGSQSLYRRRRFTWKDAGVNAVGRTINTRFDLDRNYRNTREIVRVASQFVSTSGGHNDPELGLQIIRPDPSAAMRSGPRPQMLSAPSVEGELQIAPKAILAWREKGLKPSEIAVLYRANSQGWVKRLVQVISKHVAVYWPHERDAGFSDPSGVCVRTMHSAKGLQWKAVLVMRCDMMPFVPEPTADRTELERLERALMYVAMTRAAEFLTFTRSTMNGFASEIQRLLDRD